MFQQSMATSPDRPSTSGNSEFHLRLAAEAILGGGVVLHATEGVWGLACNPFDRAAVMRLLAIKARPMSKGLILIGDDATMFDEELAQLPVASRSEIERSWPGAVSWVVPNLRFSVAVTGTHSTVAIRVPDHAQARALCTAVGGPLVSTSANLAGRPAPRNALAARRSMGRRVDLVLPGETSGRNAPSEVRSWQGKTFRPGAAP